MVNIKKILNHAKARGKFNNDSIKYIEFIMLENKHGDIKG